MKDCSTSSPTRAFLFRHETADIYSFSDWLHDSYVPGTEKSDSVTEILSLCNLELLEIRPQRNSLKLLFQILKDHISIDKIVYIRAPAILSKRINQNAAIRPYAMHTNVFLYSFFPDGMERWNGLPEHIAECTDIKALESSLDSYVP